MTLLTIHKTFYSCLFFSSMMLLSLGACKKNTPQSIAPYVPPTDTLPAAPVKKMLALGDSYTIGQSVNASERFPVQTAAILATQRLPFSPPQIIATTGWTTGNLLAAINSAQPASDFDVVTLLIGVNNQFQGRSLLEYKNQFAELLTRSIAFAANRPSRVFVLSIPDYSVTPFASGSNTVVIASEIDQFNAACKEISFQMGVTFLDITAISREAKNDQTLTASDGLHPSGKQYSRWAALLAPLIKQAL